MDKDKYRRLNITLPDNLLMQFEKFCEREGMMLSSRIATLIKKDLEEKKHEHKFELVQGNWRQSGHPVIIQRCIYCGEIKKDIIK